MVVPYPSTYQLGLHLGIVVLEARNDIKQIQSSKSHQFLYQSLVLRGVFPADLLGFSSMRGPRVGEARAKFPTPCPAECLDNLQARKQGAWSSQVRLETPPASSKPNQILQHGRLGCLYRQILVWKAFQAFISISWTSQLSIQAELCWEGWGQDLPLLLLHWTSIAKPAWRGAKWTRRPMGSPGNTSLTVASMPPSQQTLWSFSTVLLWC